MAGCSICGYEPAVARGWCAAHYYRWNRHGDPFRGGQVPRMRPRILDTEADVFAWFMPGDPPDDERCWDWRAGTRNGDGVFSFRGRPVQASQAAYRTYKQRDIPPDMRVVQTCARRICVQPAHLIVIASTARRLDPRTYIATAILTEADVRWVRMQTGRTHREIAEELGVSRDTVTAIRNGKRWKHVH